MKKAKKVLSVLIAVFTIITIAVSVHTVTHAEETACTHEFQSEITKEATNTKSGEITYKCSLCSEEFKETIPAKLSCAEPSHEICDFYNASLSAPVINVFASMIHSMYHGIKNIINASRIMNDKNYT